MVAAAVAVALVIVIAVITPSRRAGEDVAVFDVAGSPTGIAVTPREVWVAAPRAGLVSVLDAATGRPVAPSLRTGGAPARLALSEGGAWLADTEHGAVIPVRLRPQRRTFPPIELGADVTDVALAAEAVWAISSPEGVVRVLEPDSTTAQELPAGSRPVAIDADERRVVVVSADDASLTRFDARARRAAGPPIHVGGLPVAVALAGDAAWVADAGGDAIVRVDLRGDGAVSSIPVDGRPIAVAADGDDVYLLCGRDRTLVHVDAVRGEVRSRRAAGTQPVALAVDGSHVWVADAGRGSVLRFDR